MRGRTRIAKPQPSELRSWPRARESVDSRERRRTCSLAGPTPSHLEVLPSSSVLGGCRRPGQMDVVREPEGSLSLPADAGREGASGPVPGRHAVLVDVVARGGDPLARLPPIVGALRPVCVQLLVQSCRRSRENWCPPSSISTRTGRPAPGPRPLSATAEVSGSFSWGGPRIRLSPRTVP